jgi:methionine-S-sulfoxide reductase
MKNNTSFAYFAGGCFWGVEHYFNRAKGVVEALSGFMGGHTKNPTYEDVVYTDTGHLEVVQVEYMPDEISYEELAKLFFEIHDPSQEGGQGPDIGERYISAIFVGNEEERDTVKKLITALEIKGHHIATKILEKKEFYAADNYHQNYYGKSGHIPYCHSHVKRF